MFCNPIAKKCVLASCTGKASIGVAPKSGDRADWNDTSRDGTKNLLNLATSADLKQNIANLECGVLAVKRVADNKQLLDFYQEENR